MLPPLDFCLSFSNRSPVCSSLSLLLELSELLFDRRWLIELPTAVAPGEDRSEEDTLVDLEVLPFDRRFLDVAPGEASRGNGKISDPPSTPEANRSFCFSSLILVSGVFLDRRWLELEEPSFMAMAPGEKRRGVDGIDDPSTAGAKRRIFFFSSSLIFESGVLGVLLLLPEDLEVEDLLGVDRVGLRLE